MRILITGSMGYVGPVVAERLRASNPDAELIGFDAGFFEDCQLGSGAGSQSALDRQIRGDVRDLGADQLEGVDAVVHLAAVSNDPMGGRFEAATWEINRDASQRLARLAADAGVGVFVFASSCSVYGASEDGRPRREDDALNPLTAYAKSKIAVEEWLAGADLGGMAVRCLRFATACGHSPRLRLDLVLNDFVASALATGVIEVLSNGEPWRPLIDVEDMALAIDWAATASGAADRFLAVNVGRDDWNWRVRDLADAVTLAIPGVSVSVNAAAPPDRRSYRVDFGCYAALAPDHLPRMELGQSIARIAEGLRAASFADRGFRTSDLIRLRALERLVADGVLDGALRPRRGEAWVANA
jgi:nucleoside-diphosphate-sugar epimerase